MLEASEGEPRIEQSLFSPLLSCALMGIKTKLMIRDKCTWLCFVKEKLPKVQGNAFGCFARFAQQCQTKSVPQLCVSASA